MLHQRLSAIALFATIPLSVACTTEAESFAHTADANSTRSLRVDIEQGDLTLRGPAARLPTQSPDQLSVVGQSWGTASDPEKALERRDGNSWDVDTSPRGVLRIEARSVYSRAGVDVEVDTSRDLSSDMLLHSGGVTLSGTRGIHRIEASSVTLDQAGGQLELYATSGGARGTLLPEDLDQVTIYAEYGDVDLLLPRGLEYDIVVWGNPEGTVTVEDLGLQARIDTQPGYFAGRSGRGRIEIEVIAPQGDVTLGEAWAW